MKKNTQQEESNFDSRKFLSAGAKEKSLGIFGSRSLGDDRVKNIILEALRRGSFTKIISCLEPDGKSKGTINEKVLCEKSGKPIQYEILEPCKNLDAESLELFNEIDQLLAGF